MWLFRQKKTLAESGFFRGFTDCHSHLLPGIDDGVKQKKKHGEFWMRWSGKECGKYGLPLTSWKTCPIKLLHYNKNF